MSVVANYIGSLQKPIFLTHTNTSTQTLLTVAENTPGLSLASGSFVNISGAPVDCTLYVYDGTTEWPVFMKTVGAKDTGVYQDNPKRLLPGYQVRSKADASVTVNINLVSQLQQRGV